MGGAIPEDTHVVVLVFQLETNATATLAVMEESAET